MIDYFDINDIINFSKVNKETLKLYVRRIKKKDNFLYDIFWNSYVVWGTRLINKLTNGTVKEPYIYWEDNGKYYIHGACIRQRYNNKLKMVNTKIMYLKTKSLRFEKIVNMMNQFSKEHINYMFNYSDYVNNLFKIINGSSTSQNNVRVRKVKNDLTLNIHNYENWIMYFGKYKNKKMIDIIKRFEGREYFTWILKKRSFGSNIENKIKFLFVKYHQREL